MDSFSTPKREGNELEVTGISRSGRVRKKSSKLMDYDDSSNVVEKPKKPKLQSPHDQTRKKKPVLESQAQSPISHVTQTIHVAQIHHPPSSKVNVTPKKSPKLTPISDQRKKIEPSSDYETQSQSTNSESEDDNINKKLQIKEFISNRLTIDTLELAEDEIISSAEKVPTPKKSPKKSIISPKQDLKAKSKAAEPQKPTRYTAYMLWSKEMRQKLLKKDPNMEFSAISKKLGELWGTVSNQEKYHWGNRAKRLCEKNQVIQNQISRNQMKSSRADATNKSSEAVRSSDSKVIVPSQIALSEGDAARDPTKDMKIFRAIELEPIDVAAYLKLLGESLTVIGERLKEHNGQITVSGSLSVLLDSLLCALGSLICLTQQVPAIGTQNAASLSKTLENIAYIMPGL